MLQPAVLPRVRLLGAARSRVWSPRRDMPACAHTHGSLSTMGRPRVLCWARASASPLWAQSGRLPPVASLVHTRFLEVPSLPVLCWPSPPRRRPRCVLCRVSAQPTRSCQSLAAQTGWCLRGRGAFLTCLLDPRDRALWHEASFTSSWICLLSAERQTQASCSPPEGRYVPGPGPAGLLCLLAEAMVAEGDQTARGDPSCSPWEPRLWPMGTAFWSAPLEADP